MFSGYKTYITGALAVLTALAAWLVGDTPTGQFLDELWKVLVPLVAIFLRSGIKSDAGR